LPRAAATPRTEELRKAFLRLGLYKQFRDEFIPLAKCAERLYPVDSTIQLRIGNQGFDAQVFDSTGRQTDRIEVTVPSDGKAEDEEEREALEKGVSVRLVRAKALEHLMGILVETCEKKSQKHYRDCDLLISVNWAESVLNVDDEDKEDFHNQLVAKVSSVAFRAKRVFLHETALDRVSRIGG
jgi:hypothetical protein